jgi:hypothetical protein
VANWLAAVARLDISLKEMLMPTKCCITFTEAATITT